MVTRSLVFLAICGLLLLAPGSGLAQNIFEQLVMPGPLIEGHAKLEEKCEECHQPFEKGAQDQLCLACHKEVAADLDRSSGFHGKRPEVKTTACKHCHTDHKGRDFDIVNLDADTFDHRFTDFLIEGGHRRVQCDGCHAPDKKWREAPSRCLACHKEDDRHQGALGEDCAQCHSVETWTKAKFDHDKTDFPLKGKHRRVDCGSCHPGERYKETPKVCAACHRLQDVHKGRFSPKCENCHSPEDWKTIHFDHDRDTKFKLVGKHGKVACQDCHKGTLYQEDLGTRCVDCHRADDTHKGRNGEKCETCHSPRSWAEERFDHGKETRFALTGKHAKLDCGACHRGQVYKEKLEMACVSCHRLDDVHEGTAGKDCASCHKSQGWKQVTFDHNRNTDFPLKERHAGLKCQSCHRGPEPKTEKLGSDCYACHKEDDAHKGQQGKQCERCHNESGWGAEVFFDHDLTRFPLIGLHSTVPCEECHVSSAFKDTAGDCVACHKDDDLHKRRLGPACALCHNPNGWALWRFDHNKQTDYPLDGGHVGIDCLACHTTVVEGEISLSTACVACHKQDDVHRGGFGRNCERCHVTESWDLLKKLR